MKYGYEVIYVEPGEGVEVGSTGRVFDTMKEAAEELSVIYGDNEILQVTFTVHPNRVITRREVVREIAEMRGLSVTEYYQRTS
ncbi:hypothetical protein E1264_03345 [Actinomadura sp. KC216]|uniref:hypothetical protein n=1 Tax=Actinomadura sp. KC216 TaxID=2530370 RepID=UPI001042C46F|nr:hypothetical protein [Actinomadura sp. KC216]TDB90874.1 hypothetical protein E1264_03345 [Actinomadura sp. KC216]